MTKDARRTGRPSRRSVRYRYPLRYPVIEAGQERPAILAFAAILAAGPLVCRTNGPAPAPGSDDICERSRRFRSLRSLKPNYSVLGEAGR
jgi:hypothetical protein